MNTTSETTSETASKTTTARTTNRVAMSLAALMCTVFLVSMALIPFGALLLFRPLNPSRDDIHQDIEFYVVTASCALACSLVLILLSYGNQLMTTDSGYLKFARRLGGVSIGSLFVMLLAFICLVLYPHTQKKFQGADYLPSPKATNSATAHRTIFATSSELNAMFARPKSEYPTPPKFISTSKTMTYSFPPTKPEAEHLLKVNGSYIRCVLFAGQNVIGTMEFSTTETKELRFVPGTAEPLRIEISPTDIPEFAFDTDDESVLRWISVARRGE